MKRPPDAVVEWRCLLCRGLCGYVRVDHGRLLYTRQKRTISIDVDYAGLSPNEPDVVLPTEPIARMDFLGQRLVQRGTEVGKRLGEAVRRPRKRSIEIEYDVPVDVGLPLQDGWMQVSCRSHDGVVYMDDFKPGPVKLRKVWVTPWRGGGPERYVVVPVDE